MRDVGLAPAVEQEVGWPIADSLMDENDADVEALPSIEGEGAAVVDPGDKVPCSSEETTGMLLNID